MSTFIDSQTKHLCEEVDKYGQKMGFLEKPRKIDGETIPGESVEVQTARHNKAVTLMFLNGDRCRCVLLTEYEPAFQGEGDLAVFPCGEHLDSLVKRIARAVVHGLFDPADA